MGLPPVPNAGLPPRPSDPLALGLVATRKVREDEMRACEGGGRGGYGGAGGLGRGYGKSMSDYGGYSNSRPGPAVGGLTFRVKGEPAPPASRDWADWSSRSTTPSIQTIQWSEWDNYSSSSGLGQSMSMPSASMSSRSMPSTPRLRHYPVHTPQHTPATPPATAVISPAPQRPDPYALQQQAPAAVRKPISLQISPSQAPPPTPPSSGPSRGSPNYARGAQAHPTAQRGIPPHRGIGAPRGRGRGGFGAYGGDVFHPLPDHRYRRNYGYTPPQNYNYYNAPRGRGYGRGRGRGRGLWMPRTPLTLQALSSVKDDSYAATGSLGAWGRQIRPLSPPQEDAESVECRPGTPHSMPPTPGGSHQAPSSPVRQPAPGAHLDASVYPHIFDAVIENAPYAALLNLRRVSKDIKDSIDERLFRHILLCTPEHASGLVLMSPDGERLPFHPWDLMPAPAPEHRDYDDPIEQYYGPLSDGDPVDDTAALDAGYFSRMTQLRNVRVLDFYSIKSRLKQLALGLTDLSIVRSMPDFHWETYPRKWRIQAPTFVSYLQLVQAWEEEDWDETGGWGINAVEPDPFVFVIPRAAHHAILHMHYDSDKRVIATRFRVLPELRELTVVWHNSAFGQGDAHQLLPAITGLPANVQLTLVGLEPVNWLMAGNWTKPVYDALDQLGVPNFRSARVMTLAAWEAGQDELITQDSLDPRIQPFVPVSQDFGWDTDEEAHARKYKVEEVDEAAGSEYGAADFDSDWSEA